MKMSSHSGPPVDGKNRGGWKREGRKKSARFLRKGWATTWGSAREGLLTGQSRTGMREVKSNPYKDRKREADFFPELAPC